MLMLKCCLIKRGRNGYIIVADVVGRKVTDKRVCGTQIPNFQMDRRAGSKITQC